MKPKTVVEVHLRHWLETLSRWQGCESPPLIRKSAKVCSAEVSQFRCELHPLPVSICVPFDFGVFDEILHTYWWRDLWDGQPQEILQAQAHLGRASLPRVAPAPNQEESAEVGRFHLSRQRHRVHLDVAVDARKYRDMLEVWANREAWDWGDCIG